MGQNGLTLHRGQSNSVIFKKGRKTISADIGAGMQSGKDVRLTGLNLCMRSDSTEKKQGTLSINVGGLDCCSCLPCPETWFTFFIFVAAQACYAAVC